ncbi:M43 family zinc metalloprotease [Flavisolibacter ginsenosidimutans]|uniref:T9SS type A sorting domain-containing protein n=1 Tax=Flavisolibacter ginsenosidimutans TaxID=661481 RepID=A0A5B8UEW4_9BACT|nr:M43 family zinc metalloprotease [Flavisolibacter ginsenosidimutans]QEC54650.1 T9SS type A sorting domain-containing protein [Flavisolibacter ginsenosidimutans]
MRTLFVWLFLLTTLLSIAQDRCASTDYQSALRTTDPRQALTIATTESFLQQQSIRSLTGARTAAEDVIRIPVVVHVLYNNAAQNISEAEVKSQIDALNRDYRRLNADTVNTPERFRALAADVGIEFYLATADPKGHATNGIVRKYTSTVNWLSNDKIKSSSTNGDDAWDSKSYLNIWVGNLIGGAGYSSAPGGDAGKDGIVINTAAFGTIDRGGNYSMGRAAVHEVGHWLGLKHIWGDAQCGDDGIGDTPPQGGYTLNCPSGFRSTCSNGETGDMYMNYMDYTADACMNLFTQGQKKKMRASFDANGPRAAMLQSKGLREPWLEEAARIDGVTPSGAVFPNPASNEISLNLGTASVGKTIRIFNANGVQVHIFQLTTAVQKLNLSSFRTGVYFIATDGFSQRFIKL